MSREEKKSFFRFIVTNAIIFIFMMCLMCAFIYRNKLLYVGIIVSLEILILFLYYTNNPLITDDKYETIFNKIVYEIPNYKSNLAIGYSLSGLIINIFIYIVITQDNRMVGYIGVDSYSNLKICFSVIMAFWLLHAASDSTKLTYTELSLDKIFDIFNKYCNFDYVDNKTMIEEIKFFKYEIEFNGNNIFEFSVNMCKKLLAVIGIIGLTNVIKNFSIFNTAIIMLISIIFILVEFSFNNLQKTKKQILYALDIYIEKLEKEEEKQLSKVNKITKRRTRKKPNKNNVNGA